VQRYFFLKVLEKRMNGVVQEGETSVGRVAVEEGTESGEEVAFEGLH
jgi:hypothetical protein